MGKWTRRALLASGGLVGGGLVLGAGLFTFAPNRLGLRPDLADPAAGQLATWLKITPANEVIVLVPHAELGQGAQTALAMMLADELDADWDRVRVLEAPALSAYANGHVLRGFFGAQLQIPHSLIRGVEYSAFKLTESMSYQITGGSVSVRGTGQFGMRTAGAAGRQMLVAAAASRWSVPAGECVARSSTVSHAASGRTASYGELANEAARLDPPMHPRLKGRSEFTIMGTSRRRFDLPSKTDGSAVYSADVRLPGMLYAAVRAAPVFGGALVSVDSSAVERMPGVKRVVRLSNAVAVVADNSWLAAKGLEALQPQFSDGGHGALTSASWFAQQSAALDAGRGSGKHAAGDAAKALQSAAKRVEAEYRVPFLHHATMEPMGATVRIAEGRCDVWSGVQNPLATRRLAAKVSGIDDEQVTVHNQQIGGAFGRRIPNDGDFVEQAVRIAQAMAPAPVKLLWSREEDTRHGFYRSAVTSRFAGAVDAQGAPVAWSQVYAGDALGRVAAPTYPIPNMEIRQIPMASHVPEGPWRSVSDSQQGFFVESFVDELAHAARKDPFEFRRAALASLPRQRAVLERAAAMAGWGTPLPADALRRGRGIALVESFSTIVAEVCEVAVAADGQVRVERVSAAVDCGIVVNPDNALAQVQGGVTYGLSAALGEQITIEAGKVVQGNFQDYPILRFADAPGIEVEFIASDELPGGLGEPATPPIAAALANAVFAATGVHVRQLPLSGADLALKT